MIFSNLPKWVFRCNILNKAWVDAHSICACWIAFSHHQIKIKDQLFLKKKFLHSNFFYISFQPFIWLPPKASLIRCQSLIVWRARPEAHWKPRNEVTSLSPAKRTVRFEPGTFRFSMHCLHLLWRIQILSSLSNEVNDTLWLIFMMRFNCLIAAEPLRDRLPINLQEFLILIPDNRPRRNKDLTFQPPS